MSLKSFLGKVGGAVGGALIGNIPIVGGALSQAFGSAISPRAPQALPTLPTGIGGAGGFSAFGHLFGGGTKRIQPGPEGCPRGYHLNKSKTSDGLPARSICVRNRHVNPLNGRAAFRALRRVKRAVKLTRKLAAIGGSRRSSTTSARVGHRPGCGCVVCKRR